MVYVAPKRIYVSQDRRRIVDPTDNPTEPSFLLVGAGQPLDDATAEALGLTSEGEASQEVVDARTLHMPSTAFGYTETGSMAFGGGASTPLGPGGVPVQATGGTTTMPGGLTPGDVDRVEQESVVARSTAANLAAADAQSRLGAEAQAVSAASLQAESARQEHGTNVVGQSRPPDEEEAAAMEKAVEEHAAKAEEVTQAGQEAAREAVRAGDPRRTTGQTSGNAPEDDEEPAPRRRRAAADDEDEEEEKGSKSKK